MEDDDFISKTRRKKQMHDVQAIGVALTRLAPEQLARLDLPETLLEAVLDAKRMTKHEALRRQGQYIGRIMRDMDVAPIAERLEALHAPSNKQTALFHLAERWRADILEDSAAIERFVAEFPGTDPRRLRDLAEAAKAERAAEKSPKHFRELFHAISAAVQDHARRRP